MWMTLERVERYARGKAPFVGLPVWDSTVDRMVTAVFLRNLLESAVEFAKLKNADVRYVAKDHVLEFKGFGDRGGSWKLIDLKQAGKIMPWIVKKEMEKWAEKQRARREFPTDKAGRKRKALEKEIRILEKRLSRHSWYNDEPPRNPVLELGREQAERERDWDFVRDGWLATYKNKDLRRKVSRLGLLVPWKRWNDLRLACAGLGATLPDVPKLNGDRVTLDKVNPASLISMCGIKPSWRKPDQWGYFQSREHYVERRKQWLENKRTRKALMRKLEDLRELRDMPEKLAASDVGVPEGIEVETIAHAE